MAIIQTTANTFQTSLLVSEQFPDFVRTDHPAFVTFVEKYYEFLANNTIQQTSNTDVYYYGADSAMDLIPDIGDVDTTDFVQFLESFRKTYASTLPQQIYSSDGSVNYEGLPTLYKNLTDFYRAVGTEDSFRMLFRLLFNENIEIYYPKTDVLIASGGNFEQLSRIKVNHVENLNDILNTKVIGATSGASGIVEKVQVLPPGMDSFMSGQIGGGTTSSERHIRQSGNTNIREGRSNTEIYHPLRHLENVAQAAFIYLTEPAGQFDFFEEVYFENSTVSNTTILPLMKRILYFDNFSYGGANTVVSVHDGFGPVSNNSTYPPWGSANVFWGEANTDAIGTFIHFANTGIWHTTGDGQGEIKIVSNVVSATAGYVLQIGNNSVAAEHADDRHFVYARNIGIGGENRLYRMSIRARCLGSPSAAVLPEANRFSAGVACLRHDPERRRIGADIIRYRRQLIVIHFFRKILHLFVLHLR